MDSARGRGVSKSVDVLWKAIPTWSVVSFICAEVSILAPKLAMLDTGTIVQAVVSPGDLHVKELRMLLRSDEWIPYVTWHHLEELVSHENNDVVRRRFDFFEGLPHVAYLKQTREGPNLGSAVDVRDCEIAFLADHPEVSHAEVIQGV